MIRKYLIGFDDATKKAKKLSLRAYTFISYEINYTYKFIKLFL